MYKTIKYSLLSLLVGLTFMLLLANPDYVKAFPISLPFSDTFDDGALFDSWTYYSGNWSLESFMSTNWAAENSASGSDNEIQIGDSTLSNYQFKVLIYRKSVSESDINLFFRIQPGRYTLLNGHNLPLAYGLHLKDGRFALQKFTTTGGFEFPETVSNIPFPQDSQRTITIKLFENNIKVYIDNNTDPTIDFSDVTSPYLSGGIALAAITGANPSYALFDNFTISEYSGKPAQPPITKTILVPGLGASWNEDAILNCKKDGYVGNWSLASYAADIYNPLLAALPTAGWITIPYYYDWRKQIPENDGGLANLINQNTTDNEKVNAVGHSMGGLVASEYLEASQGGKLNSLLAVGAPFQGSALAYPAWSGGDIWNDNFLAKIAETLYLKHCGGIASNDRLILRDNIPSIQNLLPTYQYLFQVKTGNPIIPTETANNWLPVPNFAWPYFNVKVGSLSGIGFNTLQQISVKDPNKQDIKLGNWQDGKPAGKVYSTEGDGTVLSSSSSLNTLNSQTINQTHSGLVASSEGICKILEFLGSPCPTIPTVYSEPKSAFIVVGHPANFMLIDQNGNNHKDSNGMVSFINPKSGSYKLNLIPKSNSTLLIVAQFLPSGDIKYKEYNLQGLGPKFKSLNFDENGTSEDILN